MDVVLPVTNAKRFVGLASQELGRSVSRWVDDNNLDLASINAFVACLHEFADKDARFPENPLLWRHEYRVLLVLSEPLHIMALLKDAPFTVTPSSDFKMAIISGSIWSLSQFAINPSKQTKEIANQVYQTLCSLGLDTLFKNHTRVTRSDGTFDLVKA